MSSCVEATKCRKCGAPAGRYCKRWKFFPAPLHDERIADYEYLLRMMGLRMMGLI